MVTRASFGSKRKGFHPGKAGIIYLIKNKINNKKYIGASFGTLSNRWKWHVNKAHINTKKGSLAEAIMEVGSKNFIKRIISRTNDLSKRKRFQALKNITLSHQRDTTYQLVELDLVI